MGEVLRQPDRVGDGPDELLATLLGVKTRPGEGRHVGADHLAKLTDARLPLGLLAQVAADVEDSTGVHTWRSPQPRAARWFGFLASTGYSLSDIEQHVIDQASETTDDHAETTTDPANPDHTPNGSKAPSADGAGHGGEVIVLRPTVGDHHACVEADADAGSDRPAPEPTDG